MKDFLILKGLDRISGLFGPIGVDYPVMRKILQLKLTMDTRRVPAVIAQNTQRRPGDENKERNYFLRSLWMYAFIGCMMVPVIVIGTHYVFQMSIFFGMLMFMVMTSMISDFSSVLLDLRDKTILYPRPVNKRTIGLAKVVHVFLYLFSLTVALSAAPVVAACIRHGFLFGLMLAVEIVLSDMVILVLTALLYLVILHIFDGERLKDMINYVQIALSITIAVGYQFIGRAFELVDRSAGYVPEWWQVFIIPLWYGASFEWLFGGSGGSGSFLIKLLSVMAVTVPIAAFILYVKLLPSFERALEKLSGHGGGGRQQGLQFWSKISQLLCRTHEERAFFRFALRMMGNEREFKLKVYPSIGFSLVFPFIMLFNQIRLQGLDGLDSPKLALMVYMSAIMTPTVIMMLKYSGKYRGAWIFETAPVRDMSTFHRALLKALIVRLLLPVFLLQSLIFSLLLGWAALPYLAGVLAAVFFYAFICFKGMDPGVPFSEPFSAFRQSDGWKALPQLLLVGVIAGVHLAISLVPYGNYIFLGICVLLNGLAWKRWMNAVPDSSVHTKGQSKPRWQ